MLMRSSGLVRTFAKRSGTTHLGPLSLAAFLAAAQLACAGSVTTPFPPPDHAGEGGSGTGGAPGTGGASGTGGAPVGTGGTGAGGSGTGGSGAGGAKGGGTGGGTGGAVAVDAGAADSSGGGSTLGCAGKTYKLCEDFESGTTGGVPTGWTVARGYDTSMPTDAALARDQAHSGSMAVKSTSAVPGQNRIARSLTALGATASKHWGRIFYKVQAPSVKPAGNGVLHTTFVGLIGTSENRIVDTVEASNGTHQWLFNNPNDQGSVGSAYSWTFDANWHCAEWFVDVSTFSYRFFHDSQEVTAIGFANKTNSQMTPYTAINVGAQFYQALPTGMSWVMWFDDLAIDDNRIGCQ